MHRLARIHRQKITAPTRQFSSTAITAAMESRHTPTGIDSFAVSIPISDRIAIQGDLNTPANARGIVVFAHGSGSSRFSSRNRFVAQKLNESGCATLLVDLLTREEEQEDNVTRRLRFDIPMLAQRLVHIAQWIQAPSHDASASNRPLDTSDMKVGMFGASTGGGAALIASVLAGEGSVACVVSRGGRVDLAGDYLDRVRCPYLFLVGSRDGPVVSMNRDAFKRLNRVPAESKSLEIVDGASHLFEEPGKLEIVSERASRFFARHLLH